MTNLELAKRGLMKLAGRRMLKLQKYAPEILTGLGIVGLIAGTVMVCDCKLKAEEVLEEAKEKFDVIKRARESADKYPDQPDLYTKVQERKDKIVVVSKTGKSLLRLYGPGITLGAVSIGCILGSHKIMRGRNVALMGAYTVLEKGYNSYRKRVVEEYGEAKDYQFANGIKLEARVEEQADPDTGKIKKVKKAYEVHDPNHTSIYAKFFDELSPAWSKSPEYNMVFLRCQQTYMNDMLIARGHVFLNEVYDALGIPRTQAGAVVGWVRGENGDGYIDFGLTSERNNRFINGLERSILLDFNVDGVVYNLI